MELRPETCWLTAFGSKNVLFI